MTKTQVQNNNSTNQTTEEMEDLSNIVMPKVQSSENEQVKDNLNNQETSIDIDYTTMTVGSDVNLDELKADLSKALTGLGLVKNKDSISLSRSEDKSIKFEFTIDSIGTQMSGNLKEDGAIKIGEIGNEIRTIEFDYGENLTLYSVNEGKQSFADSEVADKDVYLKRENGDLAIVSYSVKGVSRTDQKGNESVQKVLHNGLDYASNPLYARIAHVIDSNGGISTYRGEEANQKFEKLMNEMTTDKTDDLKSSTSFVEKYGDSLEQWSAKKENGDWVVPADEIKQIKEELIKLSNLPKETKLVLSPLPKSGGSLQLVPDGSVIDPFATAPSVAGVITLEEIDVKFEVKLGENTELRIENEHILSKDIVAKLDEINAVAKDAKKAAEGIISIESKRDRSVFFKGDVPGEVSVLIMENGRSHKFNGYSDSLQLYIKADGENSFSKAEITSASRLRDGGTTTIFAKIKGGGPAVKVHVPARGRGQTEKPSFNGRELTETK